MDVLHQGILALVKSALTGTKTVLPEGFLPEMADVCVRQQSLLPLFFQGAYICGLPMQTEQMQKYQKKYFQILRHSELQMRALKQVFAAFEEHEIDYLPMKGCNMKALYPQPEVRMMGDADVLIRMEQYPQICRILESLGFVPGKESHHELPWKRDDLYLELHKAMVPATEKEFYAFFGIGWQMAELQQGHRYVLKKEDEFLFLFTHMAKHYRWRGIGIRQFLDLYVFRNTHPDMDEQYIEAGMERLHLLEFYRNTKTLLDVWFGDGIPNEKTDYMTAYIFSAGNWGLHENSIYGAQLKMHPGGQDVRNTKRKELWDAVFPPLDRMRYRFPVLKKRPYLYPLFWPVRWLQLIFRTPRIIRKKLQIVRDLDDDKVRERRQALNYVGLDFYEE
ncbi:MAG: nucleotidyltransferase family protein [Oscillospiraceae bacterium]|nr:nucleotidyltransferase family protein [Oscillospiraceae bacterium]